MEIINVEKKLFESMLKDIGAVAEKVDRLLSENQDKGLKKWLNNEEVCQILNVSKRTLQNFRDSGILPYTQIGQKMFYKSDDIENSVGVVGYIKESARRKGKEI